MKKVIGLTGGVASGKTTVAKFLKKLGAHVIYADTVGHSIQKEQDTINEIVNTFGESVLLDGQINRKALGEIVFKSKNNLDKLNEIMHPKMYKRIQSEIDSSDSKIIIIEMAILFEAGFDNLCDEYIVVYSNKSLQMNRLIKRGKGDVAEDIINSQLDIKEKIKLATYIIKNESTIYELRRKVIDLYNYLSR